MYSFTSFALPAGQCGPQLSAVAEAKGAAAKLIETVERTPAIDAESDAGKRLGKVEGQLEFDNVSFTYPTRPDAKVRKTLREGVGWPLGSSDPCECR